MKKIYSILLATVALLSIAPFAKAQDTPVKSNNGRPYILVEEGDAKGLAYSKKIAPPSNGQYVITLESFVTGELQVVQKSVPADIILVLDVSGSMGNKNSYISTGSKQWTATTDPNFGENKYYLEYYGGYYRLRINNGYIQYRYNGEWHNWQSLPYTGELYFKKIDALKDAVEDFIDVIHKNDIYEDWKSDSPTTRRTTALNNRISIVKFSTNRFAGAVQSMAWNSDDAPITEGNTAERTQVRIGYTSTTADADVTTLKNAVSSLSTGGATAADYGMNLARLLLKSNTRTDSNKVIVLFTDGEPNHYDGYDYEVAANTVNSAYISKNTYGATVFTVGVFGSLSETAQNQVDAYMSHTSSNYKEGQATYTSSSISYTGDPALGADYYKKSSGSDLSSVFTTIAGESGGSTIELDGETTSTVDIVSKSFMLPEGGKVEDIKIYTYDCYGVATVEFEEDGVTKTGEFLQFNNRQLTSLVPTLGKTDPTSKKYDSISVKGFNYSDNWCGYNQKTGKYQGQKLSIEIPVMMADDAVGGADIQTNAPGSGIYIAGQDTPFVEFVSPVVSLPINIHIRKEGLNEGESSKFTIQRKLKTENDNAWKDVTSVFVTRHSDQKEDGENAPITKVVGLPSVTKVSGVTAEYVYRIIENDWSWSYTLDEIYGYNVVYDNDGNESLERVDMTNTGALSTSINKNPFIFKNSKSVIEPTVRHAESKVTNTFKPKTSGSTEGDIKYDDSKKNTGTGRE